MFRLIPALGDYGLGGRAGYAQFGQKDLLENDLKRVLLFCVGVGRVFTGILASID